MKKNNKRILLSSLLLVFIVAGCKVLKGSSTASSASPTPTPASIGMSSPGTPTPTATATATPTPTPGPKVYVIGGYDGSGTSYATIFSASGGAWQTDNFPSGCGSSSAVVHNGKIFFVGGTCLDPDKVYSSNDGISYSNIATLPYSIQRHTVISFGGKLWTVGGLINGGVSTAVKNSVDGITWNAVGNLPAPRMTGMLVVFNNKMWYLGGQDDFFNPVKSVWSSSDGVTWNPEMNLPSERAAGSVVVMNNKMFLVGGFNLSFSAQGVVWFSSDGVSWNSLGNVLPAARSNGSMVLNNGKLWYLGGYNSGAKNDVYSSPDGSTWSVEASLPVGLHSTAAVSF